VVVQSGETLSQIAARHGVSVTELKRANGLSTGNIRAGQKLRLPS
jgi:LysM repeat protein